MGRRLLLGAVVALAAACSRSPEPSQTAPEPTSPRNIFLFLGDSLTAGYGVAKNDAYPALLAEKWRTAGMPFRVRNAGVSGSTTAGVLDNLDWHLTGDVHTVFLCIGANDGLRGHDLREVRHNLDEIVRRIQSSGARVIIAGMKVPPNYGADYAGRFESMYADIAKNRKIPLLPFLLSDVGGHPAFNIADGVHPNEKGHKIIAQNVHAFLKKEDLLQ